MSEASTLCYVERRLLTARAKASVVYAQLKPNIAHAIRLISNCVNCDHNSVGRAYILLAVASGIIGISMSTIMRLELHKPGLQVYNKISKLIYAAGDFKDQAKHLYNVTATAHGLIMVFYTLIPMLISGFGNLNIPEQLNVKSMAFPKAGPASLALLVLSEFYTMLSLLTKGTPTEYGASTG